MLITTSFNSQPPEGGWLEAWMECFLNKVSTHSRPKAAGMAAEWIKRREAVSTHSRPKAAGYSLSSSCNISMSFNSQPPEGGWPPVNPLAAYCARFNSQPPEGGWFYERIGANDGWVSTHSRPKAAGHVSLFMTRRAAFQLTAARRRLDGSNINTCWCTLFQLTAARRRLAPTTYRP